MNIRLNKIILLVKINWIKRKNVDMIDLNKLYEELSIICLSEFTNYLRLRLV